MNVVFIAVLIVVVFASAVSGVDSNVQDGRYFAIKVVDEETGRGVPLVELTTTNHIKYYTDSNGLIAFYEPGLMGRDVHFLVKSHGYEYPKDNFGYAGLTLKVTEGGSAEIKIKRKNIAERLYRITGQGIYSDSILLGHKPPISQPVINGLVMGQDSVQSVIYKDKIYWIWGDTGKPSYPLGIFEASGATSLLPGKGGLDPEIGVDLTYFVDEKGFSRNMCPIPGHGPTWLGGLVTLIDDTNQERLYAYYSKVDQAMKAQETGIVRFNDEKKLFEQVLKIDLDAPIRPTGHPFRFRDRGIDYFYFSPITRVQADVAHLMDPPSYEAYTCLKLGSRKEKNEIDRSEDGKARFAWKKNTPPLFPADEAKLIKEGILKAEEALFHIQDCDTGKPITYHGSSVNWNDYRKRWVMIMLEIFGTSILGEVWYLEADTPTGPWVYARKIVTHDTYSFYNPRHHPMFDKENGRVIFFEGTYTNWLAGNVVNTPRYDYNQIMYKLDLSNPKLALPVPVYVMSKDGLPNKFATAQGLPQDKRDLPIAFFAPDLPGTGAVPVYEDKGALKFDAVKDSAPIFYALPADTSEPPPTTTPLYEFVRASDGKRIYTTDSSWSKEGFKRSENPTCLVWKKP